MSSDNKNCKPFSTHIRTKERMLKNENEVEISTYINPDIATAVTIPLHTTPKEKQKKGGKNHNATKGN